MTRAQAFMLLLVGFLLAIVGAAWIYGPLVLIGAGVTAVVLALVVNLKE